MSLTCRGQPLTASQQNIAKIALAECSKLNAQRIVAIAMIYAAMGESSLGAGSSDIWQNSTSDSPQTEAHYWLLGGHGFQQGGGIACAANNPTYAAWQIANAVEANAVWDGKTSLPAGSDSYAHQQNPPSIAEASAVVTALYTGNIAGGGILGLGGSGTPGNQASVSLWTVGDSENPDQDYWTTINQYSQDAQWYTFSDGETLYVADGFMLMGQTPQAVIFRDQPGVLSANLTYDNTSFQGTHTHVVQRINAIKDRAALARVQSPTQCEIEIICPIDQFRAGDTVYLQLFGPADGPWLIGDCTRSVFQAYSTLTLVQAMAPLNANTGTAIGPAYQTGVAASKAGAGTVMAALIAEADAINAKQYPYVWGGGHGAAGTPSKGDVGAGPGANGVNIGFDCSGCTAAVLAAGGLLPEGSSVGGDASLVQQLRSSGVLLPGSGSGSPSCTVYDNPGVHIFLELNGQVFGTSDGGGTPTQNGGSGGAWLSNGPDTSTFDKYHVPQAILGQSASSSTVGGSGS